MRLSRISLFFFLLLTLLSTFCQQDNRTYDFHSEYSIDQLHEDFTDLRKTIEKVHPSLQIYHNKNSFDRAADSTYALINRAMTAKDFYILMSRLVTKVNCGHTFLSLPNDYWKSINNYYKHFPFKLYFQNRKAFVRSNYSQDSTLVPGTEILCINGTSMRSIVDNVLDLISSDGLNETYKYAKMNRFEYGLFPGYTDFPDSYDVTYKVPHDSTKWKTSIKGRTADEIATIRERLSEQRTTLKQYSAERIDSLSTVILTIRDFVPDVPDDYVDFLENTFRRIHDERIQNIIIDLRDNDGGDPSHAAELLSYLTDSPYVYFHNYVIGYGSLKRPMNPHSLNFKGNTYVLTDGGCFSTTGHLISLIKYHGLGILIGEETGGSFRCYGCPREYILPNTKLILQYMRCTYSTKVEGFPWGRGIKPDMEVTPHIEDLINGKDTIKEYALNVIMNTMQFNQRQSF